MCWLSGSLTCRLPNVMSSPPARRSLVSSVTVDWCLAPRRWGFYLKSKSTNSPRPWSPRGSSPHKENPHGRDGNRSRDLVISSQKLWPLDHEAGHFLPIDTLGHFNVLLSLGVNIIKSNLINTVKGRPLPYIYQFYCKYLPVFGLQSAKHTTSDKTVHYSCAVYRGFYLTLHTYLAVTDCCKVSWAVRADNVIYLMTVCQQVSACTI